QGVRCTDAIEEERGRVEQAAGLFEVVATGISLDHSSTCAGRGLQQVVLADRGGGAEPGKDRLHTGAEAGEVVRPDAAGGDHEVGVDDAAVEAHGGAARG